MQKSISLLISAYLLKLRYTQQLDLMKKTNLLKCLVLSFAWLCFSSQALGQNNPPAKLFTSNTPVWEADNKKELQLTDNIILTAQVYLNKEQINGTPLISKFQANGSGGYALGFDSKNRLTMRVGSEQLRRASTTGQMGGA